MLPMALTVAMIGFLAYQLIPMASTLQYYTFRTATVTGINELAAASKVFYIDPANANAWPADPQTLAANNYLAGFQNRNGYGYPYTFSVVGNTLNITTQVSDAVQANEVASHFAGLAVTNGNEVTVSWSVPGAEASHEALIPRDGSRDVFGQITHRAGGSAGLVLNDNDIQSVRRINSSDRVSVKNGGSGLVEADVGAIDVLTVNDIRITP